MTYTRDVMAMKPEKVMLDESSKTQRVTYRMISYIQGPKQVNPYRQNTDWCLPEAEGEGEWGAMA